MDEFSPNERDHRTMRTIETALKKGKVGLLRAKRKSDGLVVTLLAVTLENGGITPLAELLTKESQQNYEPAQVDTRTGKTSFQEPEEVKFGKVDAATLSVQETFLN